MPCWPGLLGPPGGQLLWELQRSPGRLWLGGSWEGSARSWPPHRGGWEPCERLRCRGDAFGTPEEGAFPASGHESTVPVPVAGQVWPPLWAGLSCAPGRPLPPQPGWRAGRGGIWAKELIADRRRTWRGLVVPGVQGSGRWSLVSVAVAVCGAVTAPCGVCRCEMVRPWTRGALVCAVGQLGDGPWPWLGLGSREYGDLRVWCPHPCPTPSPGPSQTSGRFSQAQVAPARVEGPSLRRSSDVTLPDRQSLFPAPPPGPPFPAEPWALCGEVGWSPCRSCLEEPGSKPPGPQGWAGSVARGGSACDPAQL